MEKLGIEESQFDHVQDAFLSFTKNKEIRSLDLFSYDEDEHHTEDLLHLLYKSDYGTLVSIEYDKLYKSFIYLRSLDIDYIKQTLHSRLYNDGSYPIPINNTKIPIPLTDMFIYVRGAIVESKNLESYLCIDEIRNNLNLPDLSTNHWLPFRRDDSHWIMIRPEYTQNNHIPLSKWLDSCYITTSEKISKCLLAECMLCVLCHVDSINPNAIWIYQDEMIVSVQDYFHHVDFFRQDNKNIFMLFTNDLKLYMKEIFIKYKWFVKNFMEQLCENVKHYHLKCTYFINTYSMLYGSICQIKQLIEMDYDRWISSILDIL